MLQVLGLERSDHVGVFPYASTCVLNAIAHVATPVGWQQANATKVKILYHQWGYVQKQNVRGVAIEDAVDSLCVPGAELFPAGSDYEIWSLPKILGCSCGGVIWCRNLDDAEKLRSYRDERTGAFLQWVLRHAGAYCPRAHLYWAGYEANGGALPHLANGEISAAIDSWQDLVQDRLRKLKIMLPFKPDWLMVNSSRLPCVVPVVVKPEVADRLTSLGITTGYRHFERIHPNGKRGLLRVYPIPIHQGIPLEQVKRAAKLILEGN